MNTAIEKLMHACAIGLLIWAQQATAATLVTDTVISQARGTQNHVATTFGQVFKEGDVPRGSDLVATFDGRPVPLQVDAKATHADGSLRHAVLSVALPSLAGNASVPLSLLTQPAPPTSALAAPVSLAQVLATSYDAQVALTVDGTPYTASARKLLQAAGANACKPWGTQCNLWLSGPLVSEWVVNAPVTAADGTENPNLRVFFAVRAYAGATPGTVGDIRTDIIVENTSAFAPQAQPQPGTAGRGIGNATCGCRGRWSANG
jgi:hypothetical protein